MSFTTYFPHPERELKHHRILVRVYDKSDQVYQDLYFFLDEVEENLYEAETKMLLYVNPSDIVLDIQMAMIDNKISGNIYKHVDFELAPKFYHP